MKVNNKYELGELVSLPNDKKKYIIYKIGVTKVGVEYLLWDGISDYPGWFWEYQLLPYEENIGFKEKDEKKEKSDKETDSGLNTNKMIGG